MIEAIVSASIAIIAAGAALTNRTNARITELDHRIDSFELRVATDYVPQQQFGAALQKMEDHMIRIENKLDQMLLKNS
jgi:hypothetical protein